jgi:hypothetical protein
MVRVTGTTRRQVSTAPAKERAQPRPDGLRASLGHATTVAMPYGFAASGLLLGLGGVALDRPLAGACGAVAGVTAGLLERYRASDAERRARWLRARLREQRAEAELEASDLRRQIRSLQTRLWERDLRDLSSRPLADPHIGATTEPPVVRTGQDAGRDAEDAAPDVPAGPVLGPPTGPIAEVIDLSEAREQAVPAEAEGEPAHGKDRAAG